MSYQAIITPIINIRPHGNADRLNLGTAAGHQVIVSKDIVEGTLGVFFDEGGQLSFDFCHHNNLHRHSDLNIDPEAKPGFFDDNRRIRPQKLRGEMSDGFWTGLQVFDFVSDEFPELKAGQLLSELGGAAICNKYYTPATQQAMAQGAKNSVKGFRPQSFPYFREHWHTNKLRMMINSIPDGALLSISEKVHGCVDATTLIDTLEYGTIEIQEIVKKKFSAHIKSWNTITEKIEYVKIQDWYFYANDNDWYLIELEDGRKIKITGNNPIWLPDKKCYRQTKELKKDDLLLVD